PLLSASANEKIDVANPPGMGDLVHEPDEAVTCECAPARTLGGHDHGVPRRVVQRDAEVETSAFAGRFFGRFRRAAQLGRNAVAPSDDPHAHTILDTAIHL